MSSNRITLQHLIDHFADTPEGRKIAAGADAAEKKMRQARLDELTKIRAANERMPELRKKLDAAVEQEERMRLAYEAAQFERLQARSAVTSASFRFDSLIGRIETELRKLPAETLELLANADREFETMWNATRNRGIERENRPMVNAKTGNVLHSMDLKPVSEVFSNAKSLQRRMAQIRAAQQEVREVIPLEADVSLVAVAARIEALRKGIEAGTDLEHIGNTLPFQDPAMNKMKPSIYDSRGLTVIETVTQPVGQLN